MNTIKDISVILALLGTAVTILYNIITNFENLLVMIFSFSDKKKVQRQFMDKEDARKAIFSSYLIIIIFSIITAKCITGIPLNKFNLEDLNEIENLTREQNHDRIPNLNDVDNINDIDIEKVNEAQNIVEVKNITDISTLLEIQEYYTKFINFVFWFLILYLFYVLVMYVIMGFNGKEKKFTIELENNDPESVNEKMYWYLLTITNDKEYLFYRYENSAENDKDNKKNIRLKILNREDAAKYFVGYVEDTV